MAWLYRSGAGLDRLYYGTDTRMAEILLGGVLATVFTATGTDFSAKTRRTLGLVGLVAYAVSAWATFAIPLADGPMWQGGFLLFAGLSILSIAGLVSGGGPLPRLLGWAPLAATGRITYGLYVYHLPIFLWLTEDRTGLSQWPLFGVRVVVTFVVAILSYHVIEMPIRQGALSRLPTRVRLASAPACVAVVVLLGFVAVDRNAPDPFATLGGGDHSLTAPVTPDDGVLDLLVITDASGGPVVDRLAEAARGDDTVRVVRAEPFHCDRLVPAGTGSVCANWKSEWTRLIRDDDPDLVLLYLDSWEPSDLSRLSGIPVAQTGQLTAAAQTYLDAGLDVLTSRGARVLWSPAGADLATQLARSTTPLHQAMANLEPRRDDLRHVLGTRLPDPKATTREQYLDRSAAALVADASLYQRATADRLPRIMIVGDSQARSLGFGLERWAAAGGHAVVWNVATEGCGLAVEGTVEGFGGETGVATRCRDAVRAYARQVKEFDPDLVVVLTSLWDLRDRRWPGSGRMLAAGTGDFDHHLLLEYQGAVKTLTSGGAHVTWMTVPCTSKMRTDDGTLVTVADITPAQIRAMNEDVLPRVARAFPAAVSLFPLDDVLCPSGRPRDDIDGVSPIRVDGVHFSVAGAEWFARRYGDRLLEGAGR